ncbi:MAG: chemotaxis protein CheA [Myxococcota bacterium]
MDEDQELIAEFLVESHENLDQLDEDFVEFERNPDDTDLLGGIFRTIHTIKGTSGFLAFNKLERLTHQGENILSKLRDGLMDFTPEVATALLKMVDAIREMLGHIEAEGDEGPGDYTQLTDHLRSFVEEDANDEEEAPPVPLIGDLLVESQEVSREALDEAIEDQQDGNERPIGKILVGKGETDPVAVGEALAEQRKAATAKNAGDQSIRVDIDLLDGLMNLVGELVLARNQILQFADALEDSSFTAATQRLNLITTELQERAMKTRMQPIGQIWSKFPRIVRDLAASCHKSVRLEMIGRETELDRTILESIKDPLTHIIRNSVDHGIESAERRREAGKPEEGLITLRAYHEGGQVIIEISDDGGGIDLDRVRSKAIEKGLVTPDAANRLSEAELINMIFNPGFSTAAEVTNVSGRGVGMDVVRTNIERIGGTVDMQSPPNGGTMLKVKIPLTLAIIPALVVTTEGDRYAIPQVNLLELVRLEGENARRSIEYIHDVPVYRLRGSLLPLIHLNEELRTGPHGEAEGEGTASSEEKEDAVNIVVLQADDRNFGLVVDEVNDTEEIVVKPVGMQLKDIAAFAGATIMGDGQVALILDILGLAQKAQVLSTIAESTRQDDEDSNRDGDDDASQPLLLVSLDEATTGAIPLSSVARLEEFGLERVEWANQEPVIQYRDQIMPLAFLSREVESTARNRNDEEGETMHVVVHSTENESVGLVVGGILDVVMADVRASRRTSGGSRKSSAIIQGTVTDLIDVDSVVSGLIPLATADSDGAVGGEVSL